MLLSKRARKADIHSLCYTALTMRNHKKGHEGHKGTAKEQVGVISITSKGTGFVSIPGHTEDIEIQPERTLTALHRDTVEITILDEKRGRRVQGKVDRIVRRAKDTFVGSLQQEGESLILVSDERKMRTHIKVRAPFPEDAKTGMKAVVKMYEWENAAELPEGKILEVIGKAGAHETEMRAIVIAQGFATNFPPGVEDEAEKIRVSKNEFQAAEMPKRRDMRGSTTFTIDPADAKDFDDAISVKELEDGAVEIGVHIADVSAYVTPGDAIDVEAEHRGTSIYLVDRTIPMLPEVLSNDVCSLNPHEDKLTFSAVFVFNKHKEIESEWFGETVINSDHRFAYEDAQKILDAKEGTLYRELELANGISEKLRAERFKEGSIAFETDEVKFRLDEHGKPLSVYFKERQATNLLIEDLMLLANKKVATFATNFYNKLKSEQPVFVYRIHDQPRAERIQELANFLKAIGYELDKNHDGVIEATDINALFKEIQGKPEQGLIETAAVRSMAKAIYSTKNIGHFGLAFKFYTHFTSPIRRYPDLMVHRILKQILSGNHPSGKDLGKYDVLCAHASEREVAAVEAERDSVKYKQVEFLRGRVGESFDGIITGVAEWGLYVGEITTKAEGLLRIRDIGDDYYTHDEKKYCLRGERTGKTYSLGDKIRVTLAAADLEEKTLTWKPEQVS